ncbi:hypothetical protein [Peribacillus asahii]|uniref:hypothetical protein n=1 Tax=Peribacillus asahii TaxID=228899 RepID=UPI00207B0843|nr:hypothetical protein [Peribacillus asahii]USK87489.1 hypothetical protein LIT35_23290 [Peribacillus asahii]
MKKLKYWGVAVVIGSLIGVAFWWATSEEKDQKDPLNQSDAFVYSDNGILYWFELTSQKGKVKGTLHQQKIIEEVGKVPFMEEKKSSLTGETTEKGYEFKVNNGGNIITFDAWFSDGNLLVQKQGEKDNEVYKAVDQEELDKYVKALQQGLQMAIYHSEEKEKNRLRKFFSDLDSVYGYLYSTENGSFQLFIKIDEALLQGELTGSLLMMTDTGSKTNPYEETRYALNGITDGLMVRFFTTVDGKETKLEGNFHEGATRFDLSFWTTDQKLSFHAVTEEEFKQNYEEFKQKAQLF